MAAGQSSIHKDLAPAVSGADRSSAQLSPLGPANDVCSALTEREVLLLVYLANAYTTAEIAARLNLSAAEVECERQRLCERCGLHSRVDIVRFVRHKKLEARISDPR